MSTEQVYFSSYTHDQAVSLSSRRTDHAMPNDPWSRLPIQISMALIWDACRDRPLSYFHWINASREPGVSREQVIAIREWSCRHVLAIAETVAELNQRGSSNSSASANSTPIEDAVDCVDREADQCRP
jgi:hypothetical protein